MPRAEERIRTSALRDPELLREYDQLDTDEDRKDFLDAMEALEGVETEGTVSWQSIKSDLGL